MFLTVHHDGKPPSLTLLAALTALGFCALHGIVPILPTLSHVFDAGTAQVQLVLTLFFAGIGVGQLVYGPLSDRFGRRPVLLAGLAMFLVGTLLCGAAWSLPALIVGRVLQAVGACAGVVLGRAIIRDVYEREAATRGIAIVMMAMTIAPAISPAVVAYLAEWADWRAVFGLFGVLGAAVLAVTAIELPETNRHPTRLDLVGMAGSYLALSRSPAFLGFALATACTSASWFTFIASAPYLLTGLMQQPPSTYGLMILLPMASYMLGNAVAARFTMQVGSLTLLMAGLVLSLGAGLAMALWCFVSLSPWALFLPIALSSIGNGLSQPAAVAAGLSVYPRIAGAASGLMGCLQMLASALGSFVVGLLPQDSALPMAAVIVLIQALAIVLAAPAIRRAGTTRPEAAVPVVAANSASGT